MTHLFDVQCDADEIARMLAANDPRAVDRLARCYRGFLLGVGRCACRDAAGAEDAVQEALLSAHAHRDQFRGGSARAWVSKMVVNACLGQRRGRKNDPDWNRPLEDAEAAATGDPRRAAALGQLGEVLVEALDDLSVDDRRLLWLAAIEEARGPEIAEKLGISPEAARARLARLRRRLRARLEEVWSQW